MPCRASRVTLSHVSGVEAHLQPLGGLTARTRPAFGLRPTLRFTAAVTLTIGWVGFSVWFSQPWRSDLEEAIGPIASWVIPVLLAYVPGLVIGFLCFTLLLTRYRAPPLEAPAGDWPTGEWPPVTVIVAAFNEADAIELTLDHIGAATYDGALEVVLADNNSTDRTAVLGRAAADRLGLAYRRIFEPVAGKHHALNTALEDVGTPIVVTVDADTLMSPEALTYLVARVTSRPQDQHVAACAGALIAENANDNFLTRMQSWDYRLGINGVKRTQAAYNSALVAQGAFSAYWTEDIRAVGGWPDAIGEDIVLTWSLLDSRGLVQYEPVALAETGVRCASGTSCASGAAGRAA
jgi:poly-beta-1,6-N-acetyl-D-glucosamine synthase